MKIKWTEYNSCDRNANNLPIMWARRMNSYSFERGDQDLSIKPKIAWFGPLGDE